MALAEELGIDPVSDVNMMILLYKLNCAEPFKIIRKEFVDNFATMKYDLFLLLNIF